MKRLLLILFTIHCSFFTILAQESVSLQDIEKGWGTKTIDNVINGSLGIMLERFDQTWPTGMVGAVRETMEKGLAKEVLDEETDLTVTIDTKNGYVEYSDGGTDGPYMSACYWNRSNGHKLFAVLLGKPTDPCLDFVCFYDYDAQKKTLTPEPDILKGYRWRDKKEFTQVFAKLPKVGKNLLVDEWGGDGPVQHTFTWNGMKPVYAKTEPLKFDDGLGDIIVNYKGNGPNIKDFVTALLSREDIGESLNGMKLSWDLYRNGMKLMPGDEFIVDTQNGYVGFVSVGDEKDRLVIECCYWNYDDKKHKLVALTNDLYLDGKATNGQYTGIEFYIYDNASRTMKHVYAQDIGAEIDVPDGESVVCHSLPRKGKTMAYTIHTPSGKSEKRLTWNGSKFIQ